MGQFKFHTACPKCGSKDNLAVYEQGDGTFDATCFGCSHYIKELDPDTMQPVEQDEYYKEDYEYMEVTNEVISAIPERGLSEETCRKYGVTVTKDDDGKILTHTYPYHNMDGNQIGTKRRFVDTKDFRCNGMVKDAAMFGMHLCPEGGKMLVITEGEIDAMSYMELTGYPAVSVKTGAKGAKKDMQANLDYLSSFETLIIAFDKDEVKIKPDGTEFYPGQDAAKECAALFKPNTVKIMDMGDLKDVNEYLMAGRKEDFKRKLWSARTYAPDGIVAMADMWDAIKNRKKSHDSVPYPWPCLNEKLYGMRTGELVTVTGGSGTGKTQFLREIEYALLQTTEENIGLLKLEEPTVHSGLGLMSIHAGIPFHLPDAEYTDEEERSAFDAVFGSNRYFAYDHFGSNSIDTILGRVRFMVRGLGCKYIILDHISIVVSDQGHGDERRALDEIATKLKMLTVELDICLIMVCHLRKSSGTPFEEGGQISLNDLRGTKAIDQLSNIVIGLERHQQAEDSDEQNTVTIRVLKNRFCGRLGVAGRARYNEDTSRFRQVGPDDLDTHAAKFENLTEVK